MSGPDKTASRLGFISGNDEYNVHGGWLTHETVVQLKLQGSKAVNIWKAKHADKKLYVKVSTALMWSTHDIEIFSRGLIGPSGKLLVVAL